MALRLEDKRAVVAEVKAVAENAHSAVAAKYSGLTVSEMTDHLDLLIINAGMLALVAHFLSGFTLASFWAALFGAILVSVFSSVASTLTAGR